MMDIILYLYKNCRELVAMGHPMSVLKAEGIFEELSLSNTMCQMLVFSLLDMYKAEIDRFYDTVIEQKTHKKESKWQ